MDFEASTEAIPFTADQIRSMQALAIERAPNQLAAVELAETVDALFYALPHAAMAAWHMEKIDLAIRYAEKALALAPDFPNDWNYGNAISAGHTVLGLVALHLGKIDEAVIELRKSGETPGSPQLNSFGPSMQLARALACQGKFEAALGYISQCRVFWEMGEVWLNLWEQKLLAKEVPNFFGNGYR